MYRGRGGLFVEHQFPIREDLGSITTQGVVFRPQVEQNTFTPNSTERWLLSEMTEKMLTWMLNITTNKQMIFVSYKT